MNATATAWAWVLGSLVTLGAVVGALTAIFTGLRKFGRWVHGSALPWLKRAAHLVDVLTDLPERLDRQEQAAVDDRKALEAHLTDAAKKMRLLEHVTRQADWLQGRVEEVLAEVKNNGGGSLKDSAHRIETALGLPTPPRTPVTTGPIATQEAPRG